MSIDFLLCVLSLPGFGIRVMTRRLSFLTIWAIVEDEVHIFFIWKLLVHYCQYQDTIYYAFTGNNYERIDNGDNGGLVWENFLEEKRSL